MNNQLIERLTHHKTERTRIRKILFKQLRSHKHLIYDAWLLRKMEENYLGDLSDNKLIKYVKELDELREGIFI